MISITNTVKEKLDIIKEHILDIHKINILELGVRKGNSTKMFLDVCERNDGYLTSIDIEDCSKVANNNKRWNFIHSSDSNFDFVNIFDIQDDFSNKILSELQVNTFLGEGKTSLSKYFPSFELYTKYLNVHTLWTEFNPESNTKAWKILEDLEKEIYVIKAFLFLKIVKVFTVTLIMMKQCKTEIY